jgi:adenylate cyclase
MNSHIVPTSSVCPPARIGEVVLSDPEGAQVRIFRDGDRYLLTADRRIGSSHFALQTILSEEQYTHLTRFSSGLSSGTAPVEVERKWRVVDGQPREILEQLQGRTESSSSVSIEQGYLVLGENEARLRRKGSECFLTLKGSGGRTRCEVEIGLSREQFEALWLGTEGRRLEKTRTSFTLTQPSGAPLVVEVDQFHGRHAPLVVVECEFPSDSAAEEFTAPSWFGEEVTEDGAYKNKSLVRNGLPPVSLQSLRAPIPR